MPENPDDTLTKKDIDDAVDTVLNDYGNGKVLITMADYIILKVEILEASKKRRGKDKE